MRFETDPHKLGERIRTLRKARGWTLRELAHRTGLSASYISDLEHGRATPRIDSGRALAYAFGLSIEELLEGTEVDRGTRYHPGLDAAKASFAAESERVVRKAVQMFERELRRLRRKYGLPEEDEDRAEP